MALFVHQITTTEYFPPSTAIKVTYNMVSALQTQRHLTGDDSLSLSPGMCDVTSSPQIDAIFKGESRYSDQQTVLCTSSVVLLQVHHSFCILVSVFKQLIYS